MTYWADNPKTNHIIEQENQTLETVFDETSVSKRIGIATNIFKAPDNFDTTNEEINEILIKNALSSEK